MTISLHHHPLAGPADDRDTADQGSVPPIRESSTRLLSWLIATNVLLAVWYFTWLLNPAHAGAAWVYGLLVTAELFNLVQAAGFWWTVRARPVDTPTPRVSGAGPRIDVLIPTFNEPIDVVEPTVLAATRLTGAAFTVWLLDDGGRPEMARLAARHGVRYIAREDHGGAKAGNLNNALRLTDAPFVAVFDCDHVPAREFLIETLGHLADDRVAFVQTPQYYINQDIGHIAAAAASQQDLFFGIIARGKQSRGAMFCCGTNFVMRRTALDEAGGFPVDSLTEDFQLSVRLHERGWTSVYVPTVLAHGLGPEDMASYVSQQARWAQGCLGALPRVLRADLPLRVRAQYLLAATYFLSGWTVLVYMSLPVLRIFGKVGPIHAGSASQFLAHFVPYFATCVLTVAVASEGTYTFGAYTLAVANFGVQIKAAWRVLLRRRGAFVVTPKHGAHGRQLRPIAPALLAMAALVSAIAFGLAVRPSAASLTNAAFASIWVGILLAGTWSALVPGRQPVPARAGQRLDLAEGSGRSVELVLEQFLATTRSKARLASTPRDIEEQQVMSGSFRRPGSTAAPSPDHVRPPRMPNMTCESP